MGTPDAHDYWVGVRRCLGFGRDRFVLQTLASWEQDDGRLGERRVLAGEVASDTMTHRGVFFAAFASDATRLAAIVSECHLATKSEGADFGVVFVDEPLRGVQCLGQRLSPPVLLEHTLESFWSTIVDDDRWCACSGCGEHHFLQMIAIVDPRGDWADHFEAVCPACRAVTFACCHGPGPLGVGESTERCEYCDRSFTNTGEAVEVTYHYD